jgi:hypothetical protein
VDTRRHGTPHILASSIGEDGSLIQIRGDLSQRPYLGDQTGFRRMPRGGNMRRRRRVTSPCFIFAQGGRIPLASGLSIMITETRAQREASAWEAPASECSDCCWVQYKYGMPWAGSIDKMGYAMDVDEAQTAFAVLSKGKKSSPGPKTLVMYSTFLRPNGLRKRTVTVL